MFQNVASTEEGVPGVKCAGRSKELGSGIQCCYSLPTQRRSTPIPGPPSETSVQLCVPGGQFRDTLQVHSQGHRLSSAHHEADSAVCIRLRLGGAVNRPPLILPACRQWTSRLPCLLPPHGLCKRSRKRGGCSPSCLIRGASCPVRGAASLFVWGGGRSSASTSTIRRSQAAQ